MNKENDGSYSRRAYFEDMSNTLGHHNLEQTVLEDTWSRIINGNHTSSRIDHVYTSWEDKLQCMHYSNESYSDHLLKTFILIINEKTQPQKPIYRRSWYGYNKELMTSN